MHGAVNGPKSSCQHSTDGRNMTKPLTSRMRWALSQLHKYGGECAIDKNGHLLPPSSLIVTVERRTWMQLEKRGLVKLETKFPNMTPSRRIYYLARVALTEAGMLAWTCAYVGKDRDT